MSNIINRQGAIEALIRESTHDGAYGYIDIKSAVEIIRQLPSAEQEIIQCRDCKHYRRDSDDIMPYCIIDCGGYGWKNDDFCSYAERKVR